MSRRADFASPRMARLTTLLLLALLLPGQAAESRSSSRPVLAEIRLADGRVLRQAQILDDSAYSVTIRHGNRLEKVEKKLLPADLAAEWPVDEQRAAREKGDAELAAQKRQAEIQQATATVERRRQEQAREAEEKAANRKPTEAELRRAKALADFKLIRYPEPREGLVILGFGIHPAKRGIILTLRNAEGSSRRLDWRQLRALANDGAVVPAADIVFEGQTVASYDLRGGEARGFVVVLNRTDIAAVGWDDRPDLGWVDFKGEVHPAEKAMNEAKARILEQRQKENARSVLPVEGQILRN